jgi:hypothetical protein
MTDRNAEIIYFPTPSELTPEQREHWERQLEASERAVEYAKRMLGQLAVEKGLSENE